MFTTKEPDTIIVGGIESRLDDIADTLQEAGVLNHRPDEKWQAFELSTFRNQVMSYVKSGAPFHHLELVHKESNVRLLVVVNFDIFNRATFGDVRAEKTHYNAETNVDLVYLNRNLAKAAGTV